MIDFEKEFEGFVNQGSGNAIKDIYSIIPSLNPEQIKIITALQFYITKYNLTELQAFLANYNINIKKNKNLNFLSSMNMKNLLKAYTQEELIRGIKISNTTNKEG